MPSFLAKLDDDTRDRYIKAKAAQGIDVTKPRVQAPAVILPDHNDEAHGLDTTRAPKMGNPEPRRFPSYQASIALETIYDCIENGHLERVRALVEDEAYHPTPNYLSQALHRAIMVKNVPIVHYLLDRGAEIDEMVAAVAGGAKSLPIFEAMVRAGWDVNAPIGHGHTVLA